jgi:hypothetical protein
MADDVEEDLVLSGDGRQSATAAAIQRGTARMLRQAGFASLFELPLANGRRADIMAIGRKGEVWIIEIKSSAADYLSDGKWPEYGDYCDRLYFAIPPEMDADLIDDTAGLILADAWGAEIMRDPDHRPLSAARRKSVMLLFARAAALRMQSLADPYSTVDG